MVALPQYGGQSNPDIYLTNPSNMSPSDVRLYLESLLVQNHQCNVKDANEIASYWVYGRGSDFYQYDLDTFKDMFGDEIGMLFFLYSRGITPGGKIREPFWRPFLVAFVYLCILIWIAKLLWMLLAMIFRSLQ